MSGSTLDELRIGYFSANTVFMIAQSLGIFRAYRLTVFEDAVPSSTEQFRRLMAGEYDLVLTSPDNVLNYRVNSSNSLKELADIRILAGVDMGMGLSLLAAPDVSSIADLRGRSIGVDVPTSGFAYAMYEVLARAGLRRHEYEVLTLGATPRRAGALADGHCAATLLNSGHDLIAEDTGARRLARVSDALGAYLGAVLAARTEVIAERPGLFGRFLLAWREAVQATLDPLNRGFVEAQLAARLSTSPELARAIYQTAVSPAEGLIPDGQVDLSSWQLLVDLRLSWSGFDADVAPELLRTALPLVDTHVSAPPESKR